MGAAELVRYDHRVDYQEFAVRMKAARLRSGMAQEALAQACGVSFVFLNKLENGKAPPPRIDLVMNIATALGVSPFYLLGHDESPDEVATSMNIIEEFILSEPRVTPEHAERLRGHRWSAPGGVTVGMVREAWLNMALEQKGVSTSEPVSQVAVRPGRVAVKPLAPKKR